MKINKSRCAILGLMGAAAMLAGCQAAPVEPASRWVPAATARLVTFGRSTTYALAHHDSQDLLIVEDPILSASGSTMEGRLVWIVPLPSGAAIDAPVAVGGPGAEGWLIEQREGKSSHATPASGEVVLHARTDEQVQATVSLHAEGPKPAAGEARAAMITINETAAFARHAARPPQYAEMRTRSGVKR